MNGSDDCITIQIYLISFIINKPKMVKMVNFLIFILP